VVFILTGLPQPMMVTLMKTWMMIKVIVDI
jgi:hypothetical protein